MKKVYVILAFVSLFVACKNDSSKKDSSEGKTDEVVDNFSENEVDQIIAYYNAVINYESKASKNLERLREYEFSKLEDMAKTKTKPNGILTWTSFIGISPSTTEGFGQKKVDILEPEKALEDDLAAKVKPIVDSIVKAYNNISSVYKEYKDYYKNEDYLDDDWQKATTYINQMNENAKTYYSNKEEFYRYILPLVEKAEERVLEDHPLKKEILLAKKTMKVSDNIVVLLESENVDMKKLELLYAELEEKYNEALAIDTKALKENSKETSFKNYFKAIDNLIGKIRKAKRDGNISDDDYDDIFNSYSSSISSYNSFVM